MRNGEMRRRGIEGKDDVRELREGLREGEKNFRESNEERGWREARRTESGEAG